MSDQDQLPKPAAMGTLRSTAARMKKNGAFVVICLLCTSVSLLVLAVLLVSVIFEGHGYLTWTFLTNLPSRNADESGMLVAILGSVLVCGTCGLLAMPMGLGTAILLEEFRPKFFIARWIHSLVQINIANLAGVPSIVYGIIGLTLFVNMVGLFGNANEPAYQFGLKHYQEFYDESGFYAVAVPVDDGSEDSPIAEIEAGMKMQYTGGAPNSVEPAKTIELKIADEATIEKINAEIDEAVAAFEKTKEAELAKDESLSEDERFEALFAAGEAKRGELAATKLAGYAFADQEPYRFPIRQWYYIQLPFGRSVLAGGLTLMMVILPIVIIASQEALRAVPDSLREGALACGATKWQMVRTMTLPSAVPGICTGLILAMSRAIGEAAPILIITGGLVFVNFKPDNLMSDFTAMPQQIYSWARKPQAEFHQVAAAGIIVLLAVLLSFNALAVFIRNKFQKPLQ